MRSLAFVLLLLASCGSGSTAPVVESEPTLAVSPALTFYDGPVEWRVVSYLAEPVLTTGGTFSGIGMHHVVVDYGTFTVSGTVFMGAPVVYVFVMP